GDAGRTGRCFALSDREFCRYPAALSAGNGHAIQPAFIAEGRPLKFGVEVPCRALLPCAAARSPDGRRALHGAAQLSSRASCVRLAILSLRKIELIWHSMVLRERHRRSAMASLRSPEATSPATLRSLGDRHFSKGSARAEVPSSTS